MRRLFRLRELLRRVQLLRRACCPRQRARDLNSFPFPVPIPIPLAQPAGPRRRAGHFSGKEVGTGLEKAAVDMI